MSENAKILTKHWDQINPNSIESYLKKGGYEGLQKALRKEPEDVVGEVKKAGLQGRGGGGFAAGDKWEITAKIKSDPKYFICNLDESEPGAFKDRMLAEKNPHQILEGIIIGCYAMGAKKAYIYLNGNFKVAQGLLQKAIEDCYERNFLGQSVIGSAFDLDMELFMGAGAYICGEESALINSMEGKRGEPRKRPPFVCDCGLWNKPTVVNNAETISNVPWILKNGAKKYQALGIKEAPGTKLFCVDGAVAHPGIYEAPLGTSVRELIYDLADGIALRKEFWFAQVGGSAGHIVTKGLLDETPTYSKNAKVHLGSGAVLVIDKSVDLKKLMLSWMRFFQRESCGKCVSCREGTFRLLTILKRLEKGDFSKNDKEDMEKLIYTLDKTTFCSLGQFSVVGIKDVIKYKLIDEFK